MTTPIEEFNKSSRFLLPSPGAAARPAAPGDRLSADRDPAAGNIIDDREADHVEALLPEILSAPLKALLDRDADAADLAFLLAAQLHHAAHGVPVRQKIIHDQHS